MRFPPLPSAASGQKRTADATAREETACKKFSYFSIHVDCSSQFFLYVFGFSGILFALPIDYEALIPKTG